VAGGEEWRRKMRERMGASIVISGENGVGESGVLEAEERL